jgi:hypothetical protein
MKKCVELLSALKTIEQQRQEKVKSESTTQVGALAITGNLRS